MPQFDVTSFSSQLFWLVIVFGCLYFLISKFIAPKAEYILSRRDSILEENINNAESFSQKAKELELLKRKQLVEVNLQLDTLYKQAIDQMDREFAHQKEELNDVLGKKREKSLLKVQSYIAGFHANEAIPVLKLAAFIIHKITAKDASMDILEKIQGKMK